MHMMHHSHVQLHRLCVGLASVSKTVLLLTGNTCFSAEATRLLLVVCVLLQTKPVVGPCEGLSSNKASLTTASCSLVSSRRQDAELLQGEVLVS